MVQVNAIESPLANVAAGDRFASTKRFPPVEASNNAALFTVVVPELVKVWVIWYEALPPSDDGAV